MYKCKGKHATLAELFACKDCEQLFRTPEQLEEECRDEMQARKTRPTVERVYRIIYWVLGVVLVTLWVGIGVNVYKVVTILGV